MTGFARHLSAARNRTVEIPFALDWITPKGTIGNGNPIAYYGNPAIFPEVPGENIRLTPYETWSGQLVHAFRGKTASAHHLIAMGKKFVYEMVTFGSIKHALGKWSNPHHRAIFQNVSDEVKEAVRRGQAVIVFNTATEGYLFIREEIFDELYKQIAIEGFPPGSVWVVTSNQRAAATHDQWLGGKAPMIRVYEIDYYEEFMRAQIKERRDDFVTQADAKANALRPKRFLSLNRRGHPHRQVLVSQMIARGLHETSLVSMPSPDEQMYTPLDPSRWYGFPTIAEDVEKMRAMTPLVIDTPTFATSGLADTHVRQAYLDTYVSVVPETMFLDSTDERLFITEKTYKPIFNFQPFIIVGYPGLLRRLREKGYKTFSGFIDESYDDEPHDPTRMRMILDEMTRLSSVPVEEMRDWYLGIFDDVLVHNQRVAATGPSSMRDLRIDLENFVK